VEKVNKGRTYPSEHKSIEKAIREKTLEFPQV
jgi:hypothetical protein